MLSHTFTVNLTLHTDLTMFLHLGVLKIKAASLESLRPKQLRIIE